MSHRDYDGNESPVHQEISRWFSKFYQVRGTSTPSQTLSALKGGGLPNSFCESCIILITKTREKILQQRKMIHHPVP